MYRNYWGLSRPPFPAGPDTGGFVTCPPHRAALLKLRHTIEAGLGAAALIGEIGTGKTTVVTRLGEELSETFEPFVHVVFPLLNTAELIAWMAVELGADQHLLETADDGADVALRVQRNQLTEWSRRDRHPVLVIDEAHVLNNSSTLKILTLLLNCRIPPRIAFALLLIGHTSLAGLLSRVPQLSDRLSLVSQLPPLSQSETADYVSGRLAAAGCTRTPFAPDALATLHALSGGTPRAIGRLCDLALLVGYADGLDTIRGDHIHDVALELPRAVLRQAS